MKASLCIEAIGHNTVQQMKLHRGILRECGMDRVGRALIGNPMQYARWGVREVTPDGAHVLWTHGRTDYSQANGKGSRGVRIWYALESGKRYHVKAPVSWKSNEEYYCHVTEDGNIVRE